MPILYSTVARGTTVLAKYTECVGNFQEVTGLVLNTIELRNNKCTYTNGPYAIHYICQDNIIYMCITEIVRRVFQCRSTLLNPPPSFVFQEFERGRAFIFLEEIARQFVAEYGLTVATAIAYGMNSEFSQVLALEMRRFNEVGNSSIMTQVHGQIDELKNIMVRNIDNVTARGERIELLVNKTENLRNSVRRSQKPYIEMGWRQ